MGKRVFNGDECIFMAPPAQFVPQLMDELFEWMKKIKEQCSSIDYEQCISL